MNTATFKRKAYYRFNMEYAALGEHAYKHMTAFNQKIAPALFAKYTTSCTKEIIVDPLNAEIANIMTVRKMVPSELRAKLSQRDRLPVSRLLANESFTCNLRKLCLTKSELTHNNSDSVFTEFKLPTCEYLYIANWEPSTMVMTKLLRSPTIKYMQVKDFYNVPRMLADRVRELDQFISYYEDPKQGEIDKTVILVINSSYFTFLCRDGIIKVNGKWDCYAASV